MNVTRCTTLALLLSLCATLSFAQEPPKPSAEHKVLRKDVGVWNAKMTIMIPGQDPMVEEGVETNRMLGGIWVISEFKGSFGDQKFTGHGQFGYDAKKKKYVGTWIDSMEPYMSTMEGDFDADTNTMTMMSTGVDPESGKPRKSKIVTVYKDKDTRTMSMYMDVGEDKWTKSMEMVYTRKAKGKSKGGAKKKSAKKEGATDAGK